MRSSDLARLAGVSVRTLRHYHAVGLLPEPPRHANGYRDYDALDLLRLLRIRQLASLGLPLGRIGVMLDDLDARRGGSEPGGGSDADAALAELDAALAEQVAHLQEQRRLIARIRAGASDADFPERASGTFRALDRLVEEAGRPGALAFALSGSDRLALGIAAHLYSASELSEMERVFTAICERGLAAEYSEVSALVEGLPEGAPEGERAVALDRCLAFLAKIEDCFDAANWFGPTSDYESFLDAETASMLNDAQRDVSARLFSAFEERLARRL